MRRVKCLLRTKKYGIFTMKEGCDCMLATNAQQVIEPTDTTKSRYVPDVTTCIVQI